MRIQAYISPELEVAILNEANEREITIGALIEEVFHARVVMFTKTPEIR